MQREDKRGIPWAILPGAANRVYWTYLLVQAVIVMLWWPKLALLRALETHDAPDTLPVALLLLGIAVPYFSLRLGAGELEDDDELTLLGRLGLPDAPPAGALVANELIGAFCQSFHLLVLTLPIVLVAVGIGGGALPVVAACIAFVLPLAVAWRLFGVVCLVRGGEGNPVAFFMIRASFVVVQFALSIVAGPVSHVALVLHLLGGLRLRSLFGVPDGLVGIVTVFTVFHVAIAIGLTIVLYYQVQSKQRGLELTAGASSPPTRQSRARLRRG